MVGILDCQTLKINKFIKLLCIFEKQLLKFYGNLKSDGIIANQFIPISRARKCYLNRLVNQGFRLHKPLFGINLV